jgi:hypothetical protein
VRHPESKARTSQNKGAGALAFGLHSNLNPHPKKARVGHPEPKTTMQSQLQENKFNKTIQQNKFSNKPLRVRSKWKSKAKSKQKQINEKTN